MQTSFQCKSSNDLFVNRKEERAYINRIISPTLIDFWGIQGMGKSRLLQRILQHIAEEKSQKEATTVEAGEYPPIACDSVSTESNSDEEGGDGDDDDDGGDGDDDPPSVRVLVLALLILVIIWMLALIKEIAPEVICTSLETEAHTLLPNDSLGAPLNLELRKKLGHTLKHSHDESELRDLCFFEIGVDYEDLPGQSKQDKVRELIKYCERHDLIDTLSVYCKKARPFAYLSD